MQIFGIKTPMIKPGDDIFKITIESAKKNGIEILNNDILVFSAKVIAITQGRIVDLSKIQPSDKAKELATLYEMDPRFVELIIRESDEILGGVRNALLTIKKGIVIANGGVDLSNAPPGFAALWPEDPQKSAEEIRQKFKEMGINVGVLVIDSRVLPMRIGNSAVALGISGFKPVEDLRGKKDLYGKPMRIKQLAIADNIATAALLVMGETSESTPIALVRNAKVTYGEGFNIKEAIIPKEECLIMHFFKKI
ncbi:MAG: coenzyme F420-0:L-glutamate ligase [Candidatus Methanomethylicaceae archaeon]|nr:coenzyme F420-0:L-glutamate ligase [Candidatus Verstraetearchaeota archaeon]